MEPSTRQPDVVMDTLYNEGFLALEDPSVGEAVSELERNGFPFWSEEGLDFVARHIINEPYIRNTLRSWFKERCVLVHCLRYQAYPGVDICFRRGGPRAGRRRFMIHLLPKQARAGYYSGSHLHELPTEETEYLFYKVSHEAIEEQGLQAKVVNFEHGGRVMIDARLSLELKECYIISFVFATEDVVAKWPPMYLPNLPILKEKVDKMETPDIGVNFAFRHNKKD
ncbi:unnamed protein product [Clonostachys rosea f. rosea IK726]|uniref:Uncharacterized protein n=1 Tax=Clonostachys rosea f. rosea IK726 TaxID=1349383 RepID=A0ACA9U8U4_BIOOC|nr:unnamed protein product [Clonostachys rosea f. rosea IK726]